MDFAYNQENKPNNEEEARYSQSLGMYNVKNKKGLSLNTRTLLFFVVILQIGLIVLIVYLSFFRGRTPSQDKILDEVGELVDIESFKSPEVTQLLDVDYLKSLDAIQAEVLKDAQNGDWVVSYEDQMIIYRRDDDKIIYNDKTALKKIEERNQEILNDISSEAKEKGFISSDSAEVPTVTQIANASSLRKEEPVFYSQAENGDFVVTYEDAGVILLYRLSDSTIYNSGTFSVNITAN